MTETHGAGLLFNMETEKEKQLGKERIRNRARHSKRREPMRVYLKEYNQRPDIKVKRNTYMREYAKKPEVIAKKKIRRMTMYYYGKVPKGYHRHHLNYDSSHNFILVTVEEHGVIHREKCQ